MLAFIVSGRRGFIDWLGLLGLNIPLKYDQVAIGQRKLFPLRGNLRKRKTKHIYFTISERSSHGDLVGWLHLRGRRGKPACCIQCGTDGGWVAERLTPDGLDCTAYHHVNLLSVVWHRPNENKISHCWRELALLRISTLKLSLVNLLAGQRLAGALG